MRLIAFALALTALIAPRSVATTGVRLQGLDRLYFEQVKTVPSHLIRFLPEVTRTTRSRLKAKIMEGELETYIEVRDFRLPLRAIPRKIALRQIIVNEETARIAEVWWALHDNGKRTDVWYFRADPTRTENKAPSNYEIEVALAASGDIVELQVLGTMFRPQGAWWITGKIFSLSMQDNSLMLFRVRNAFGFFQSYDLGDTAPPIDVSTEHEVRGHFETLTSDSVPDQTLRECGFRHPSLDDNWTRSWTSMERTVVCVTSKAKVRASSRSFDEPSFIERGGRRSEEP